METLNLIEKIYCTNFPCTERLWVWTLKNGVLGFPLYWHWNFPALQTLSFSEKSCTENFPYTGDLEFEQNSFLYHMSRNNPPPSRIGQPPYLGGFLLSFYFLYKMCIKFFLRFHRTPLSRGVLFSFYFLYKMCINFFLRFRRTPLSRGGSYLPGGLLCDRWYIMNTYVAVF